MTDPTGTLLVIDDEENMRHMLSAMLTRQGYQVRTASDGQAGLTLLGDEHFDFILCDIKMPGMDGMAFLRQAQNVVHAATIIMMSAFGSIDLALEAMKMGAYDYISKPFKSDEVLLTLKKAEERERLLHENRQLKAQVQQLRTLTRYGKMITASQAMQRVIQLADRVAGFDTTVLVTGESGTGKELMTHAIHSRSPRCDGPFIPVNCGGIPEDLLESEFFGHIKGAFTGADQDKKGLFAAAQNGTLFLDEIGELPQPLQVKLLRVLQEKEIRPVGADKTQKIDVRIIAATSKDLQQEVRANHFREDLFYRLNVVELVMPPLRDRVEDILLLTDHFIKIFNNQMETDVTGVSEPVRKIFMKASWPGNVRELEHVIEHAVIMAGKGLLSPEHLPEPYRNQSQSEHSPLGPLFETISIKQARKLLERRLIERAQVMTEGNKSQAAEMLEISYPSLLDKIKKYRIDW